MLKRLATVAFVASVCGPVFGSAQTPPRATQVVPPTKPVPAFAQLQNWIQLSKTHQIGQPDDAVRTLASWPLADIQIVDRDLQALFVLLDDTDPSTGNSVRSGGHTLSMKDLPALFDLFDLPTPEGLLMDKLDPAQFRKADSPLRVAVAKILIRAAMMHTDFLTAASRDEMVKGQAAAATGTAIRVNDGQGQHVLDIAVYWSCARTAMDIAEPSPSGGTLVRDWYVASSAYLLSQRDYASGVRHFEHARITEPQDAILALYLGAAYENLAAPPIQAEFQNGAAALTVGSRPELLWKAEFQLRSALLLAPDSLDARLRLGRTLLLMARPDEAFAFLGTVEAASRRAEPKYFAALFSALAHAQAGHIDDGLAAAGRAAALAPFAQSPRLVTAQLLMLSSKRDEALAAIQFGARDRANPSDPLWAYDIDLAWNVNERMTAMRATVNDRLR